MVALGMVVIGLVILGMVQVPSQAVEPLLRFLWEGGNPPCHIGKQEVEPSYLASHTHHTGEKNMTFLWSLAAVNVVDGSMTIWAG